MVKILANRLKLLLPDIISPQQSTFVPSCLITNNILIACEVLRSLSIRLKGNERFMALKLNMSKAYEKFEWKFFKVVMLKLGFHPKWVSWIMVCVFSVTYSILVNGVPHKCAKPSRGIRHGDHLSPYLFIMCVEALSCLLLHADNYGYISSFPMGSGSLRVSHLFFVDDSLIFCKANSIKWSRMLSLIATYEQAFVQLMKKEKSSIFFSFDNSQNVKNTITRIAGTRAHGRLKKYLGLPTCLGQNKSRHFHFLLDKTWSRMSNQKTKFLFGAGREILLKVVLQAILTYNMSIFLLSRTITTRLNGLYRKFW